jgi:hypothetical protein
MVSVYEDLSSMKRHSLRISGRGMMLIIAVVAVVLAVVNLLRPMNRETAIQLARQHAKKTYRGINLDGYAISAPARADWFEEWNIRFDRKSGRSGFIIDVDGGDVYAGFRLNVFVDNEWGMQRSRISARRPRATAEAP